MVSSCCIKGCKSEQYPGCQKSFHKFPSDEKLRKKWMKITGCTENVQYKKICLLHFRNKDFIIYTGRKCLRRNAVPFYVIPPFKIEPDTEPSVVETHDKLSSLNKVYHIQLDEHQDECDNNQMKSIDNRDEDDNDDHIQGDEIDDLQRNENTQINKGSIEVDVSNPRCTICLKNNNLNRVWQEHYVNGDMEVYGDMLVKCFALSITKPVDPSEDTGLICESCIMRLKDAVRFKTEVLASELFLRVQKESMNPFNVQVKREIEDIEDIETEYLNIECIEYDVQDVSNNADKCNDFDKFDKDVGDKKITDPIMVQGKREKISTLVKRPNSITTQNSFKEEEECVLHSTKHNDALTEEKLKHLAPEGLRRAVEAVTGRQMSRVCAANNFNVTTKAIAKALKNELEVKQEPHEENSKLRMKTTSLKNKKKQAYPTNNLLRAVDDVWNKKMTQTQASKYYKVPRSTIFDLLIKNYGKPPKMEPRDYHAAPVTNKADRDAATQEMAKHTTNILAIMENSNATPIRCHGDGGYACCFCDQRYHRPGDLKTHTIQSHDKKTKRTFTKGKRPSSYFVKLDVSFLKCNICNTDIDTIEKLIEHLINDHQKTMYTDIKNHILPFKFESDELRCAICGNFFNKFKVLQEHLNAHYRNYVCDVCNAGFVSRMILYNHCRGHSTGVFQCDQCPKVYNTQRKLRSHQSLVHRHSYMVSKCGYCNEKFKSYHRKLEHLTSAHDVRPSTFVCRACDRSFNSQAGLRIHRKRDHLMERKYKCTECDMKFFAKAAVDTHMLKHSSARLFQCDVCKKSYKRKSTLREHLRIHENNRRFKCEQCGAAFVQKCSWRGHMRSKHGIIS